MGWLSYSDTRSLSIGKDLFVFKKQISPFFLHLCVVRNPVISSERDSLIAMETTFRANVLGHVTLRSAVRFLKGKLTAFIRGNDDFIAFTCVLPCATNAISGIYLIESLFFFLRN